jgi:hypothetical protein
MNARQKNTTSLFYLSLWGGWREGSLKGVYLRIAIDGYLLERRIV